MIIRQSTESDTQTDKDRGLMDSSSGAEKRVPGITEEVSEDAYKQNYVYRSLISITPKDDKTSSHRNRRRA